jgi:hypothetical protein
MPNFYSAVVTCVSSSYEGGCCKLTGQTHRLKSRRLIFDRSEALGVPDNSGIDELCRNRENLFQRNFVWGYYSDKNFGSLAITRFVTHGFASYPHEQFAFVGF